MLLGLSLTLAKLLNLLTYSVVSPASVSKSLLGPTQRRHFSRLQKNASQAYYHYETQKKSSLFDFEQHNNK